MEEVIVAVALNIIHFAETVDVTATAAVSTNKTV